MKKICVMCVLLMFASAGMAFAASATTAGGQAVYGAPDASDTVDATATSIGKLSNNVNAGWALDTTDPVGQGYAIDTFHSSGSQAYGTAHDSTSIYMLKSTSLPTLTNTGTADFVTQSWTAL